jgi:hypothetical protein
MKTTDARTAKVRVLFLHLLRAGLWGTAADAAQYAGVEDDTWRLIFLMARSQAVAGLTLDGIATLPAEVRPPREVYMQWAALTAQIESRNRQLDETLVRVFRLYRDNGLHPVLLKGQGVARCYINPMRRTCGDIDIYLGRKDLAEANRLLAGLGGKSVLEDSDRHSDFILDGVTIENHRLLAQMNVPRAHRYICGEVNSWYPDGADRLAIAGYEVSTPPATFNAFYIFQHIFQHILTSGIGLRQVCDWVRVLEACREQIDLVQLGVYFKKTGLQKAARTLGYVVVHHLGLPPDCLPFAVDDMHREGERMLDDIFTTGNFGQYDDTRKLYPKGYWRGKWYTMRLALQRNKAMGDLAPGESRWNIVALIRKNLYIQIKKKLPLRPFGTPPLSEEEFKNEE